MVHLPGLQHLFVHLEDCTRDPGSDIVLVGLALRLVMWLLTSLVKLFFQHFALVRCGSWSLSESQYIQVMSVEVSE